MGRRFESCRAHDFLPGSGLRRASLNSVYRSVFRGRTRSRKIMLEEQDAFAPAGCPDSVLLLSCACSKVPGDPQASASKASSPLRDSARAGLGPLFSHIWRLTKAPSQPAAGTIYIFLANGTLL